MRPTTQRGVPHSRALPAGAYGRPTGGAPLLSRIQRAMEALFQTSFADVRVHVGPEAAALGALAYACGPDLYFAPGRYRPEDPTGLALLAHELTHVVQQRQGRVGVAASSPWPALVDDPALEAEAEEMAARAARLARQAGCGLRAVGAPAGPARLLLVECRPTPERPAMGQVIQCYRIVKSLGVDHHEVEFTRNEDQPKGGRYRNDGCYYEDIGSTQTTRLYERTRIPPPDEEEDEPPTEEVSRYRVSVKRHLRARDKKVEGKLFRMYYQLDESDLRDLRDLRVCCRDLAIEIRQRQEQDEGLRLEKIQALQQRIVLLERRRTRSAIEELRQLGAKYKEKAHVPNVSYRVKALLSDAPDIVGGFRARAMIYQPDKTLKEILSLDCPKLPKLREKASAVESRFDILARKSGAPPKGIRFTQTVTDESVHEVDLAKLPTQGGIPIDWVRVLTDKDCQLPMIVTLSSSRPEKVMAIGFQGAIDFAGELTVGGDKATRIYGLLLPQGAIDILGVKMRDQDSPDLNTFKKKIRPNEGKIFSIRYEKSTAKNGQAHLHDDWLLELEDGSFISQTEYLRSISYGLVELTCVDEEWIVRAFTSFDE